MQFIPFAEFRTAFELFDKDSSGAISADELGTVMRNLGLNPSHEELKQMVELHDFDSQYTSFLYSDVTIHYFERAGL